MIWFDQIQAELAKLASWWILCTSIQDFLQNIFWTTPACSFIQCRFYCCLREHVATFLNIFPLHAFYFGRTPHHVKFVSGEKCLVNLKKITTCSLNKHWKMNTNQKMKAKLITVYLKKNYWYVDESKTSNFGTEKSTTKYSLNEFFSLLINHHQKTDFLVRRST